jgi:uncharacterized protein
MELTMEIVHQAKTLMASVHLPNQSYQNKVRGYPVVIICHGFVGNRIGVNRLFVNTARELTTAGFGVVRFDYGGCGESFGDYGSSGLDVMVDETQAVIHAIANSSEIHASSIVLLGHSLGGATALVTANQDSRVSKLILWSPVLRPYREIRTIVGQEVLLQATVIGATDYLGYRLQRRFFESLRKYHLIAEARQFLGDVLVLHGSNDEDIAPENASIYQKSFGTRSTGKCDVKLIKHADHTFSSLVSTASVVTKTRDWLEKYQLPVDDSPASKLDLKLGTIVDLVPGV